MRSWKNLLLSVPLPAEGDDSPKPPILFQKKRSILPLRCRGMDKIAQLDMQGCGGTPNETYRAYRAYKPDRSRKGLVVPEARQKVLPRQTPRNQERYRTAGRVLPRSPRGEWTCVLDPSGDDRKARSGKARSLRVKKKAVADATAFWVRSGESYMISPIFLKNSIRRLASASASAKMLSASAGAFFRS